MSTGRKKTLGQRFGLLTGFGLILGGVAGWGWSLLQAPGNAAVEPVATPQPPKPSTTVVDSLQAAAEKVTAPVAEKVTDTVEKVTDTVEKVTDTVEEAVPDQLTELVPDSIADVPTRVVDAAGDTLSSDDGPAEPAAEEATPTAPAKPTDVPDAVKAIRAAAAAARERLELPTKALPDPAGTSSDTEVG